MIIHAENIAEILSHLHGKPLMGKSLKIGMHIS